MVEAHRLSAALEDYVEAIARLIAEKGAARVRDLAQALSVHKSTVTAALRSLAEKELINYAPYETATLTSKGKKLAREIVRRHNVIQSFLSEVLLVPEKVAAENACRMEHVMDKGVLRRLSLFAEFVKECPRTGEDWLSRFGYYYEHDGHVDPDEAPLAEWVDHFRQRLALRDQGKAQEPDLAAQKKE